MSATPYDEFEIVGFEGGIAVECETVLPIARHIKTDLFAKYVAPLIRSGTQSSAGHHIEPIPRLPPNPAAMFTRAEADKIARQEGLTFLPEPVAAFEGAMVIYVTASLLDSVDEWLPPSMDWQILREGIWVACSHKSVVDELMNRWGEVLMNKATDLLERIIYTHDRGLAANVEHLSDLALCVAGSETLRARIYLRSGLAITLSSTPERLDNLYQLIIRREFRDWTWDEYRKRLDRLAEILRLRISLMKEPSRTEGARQTEERSFQDIAQLSSHLDGIEDIAERYAECEAIARRYREQHHITDDDINRVALVIRNSSKLRLDGKILRVLKGEPLFYYLSPDWFRHTHHSASAEDLSPLIDSSTFIQTARNIIDMGLMPGILAERTLGRDSLGGRLRA
jgi:hypothetical protein